MATGKITYVRRDTRYSHVTEVHFAGRVVGYIDHRRGSKLYNIVMVEPDIRNWLVIKGFGQSFDSRDAAAWHLAKEAQVLR